MWAGNWNWYGAKQFQFQCYLGGDKCGIVKRTLVTKPAVDIARIELQVYFQAVRFFDLTGDKTTRETISRIISGDVSKKRTAV